MGFIEVSSIFLCMACIHCRPNAGLTWLHACITCYHVRGMNLRLLADLHATLSNLHFHSEPCEWVLLKVIWPCKMLHQVFDLTFLLHIQCLIWVLMPDIATTQSKPGGLQVWTMIATC